MAEQNTASLWGKDFLGYNQSIGFYPDMYANYWSYNFKAEENPGIGIQLKGFFPKARFFNITVYDDERMHFISSILDVDILPDEGFKNPFKEECVEPQAYTLHFLPEGEEKDSLENVIYFQPGVNMINLVIRYYLPEGDDKGGVDLPTIKAFDLKEGGERPAPERAASRLDQLPKASISPFRSIPVMPFMRSVTNTFYPNPPAEYLYSSNVLSEGKVALFSFRAPNFPNSASENANSDVRYWSINIGDNHNTCTYFAIKDDDAQADAHGMFHFIVADSGSSHFAAIKKKLNGQKGLNLIPWNVAEQGEAFIILYRHMVSHPDFSHNLQKMDQYIPFDAEGKPLNPPPMPGPKQIAHLVLGDYGPYGKVFSESDFLADTFSLESIRK